MKVAVCISGQLRTGLGCIANQRLFFDGIRPHFFIHTWDTNTNKRFTQGNETTKVPTEILHSYFDALKPIAKMVENAHTLGLASNGRSHHALFYSWMRSIQLKRTFEQTSGFRYDIVVKLRPDLLLQPGRKLIEEIAKCIHDDAFLINNLVDDWEQRTVVDDVMWIAKNHHMDQAINYYQDILLKSPDSFEPEMSLGAYLKKVNIKVSSTKEWSYTVYRKECEPLDPISQYDECFKQDWHYFGLTNDLGNAPGWIPQPNESPDYYT